VVWLGKIGSGTEAGSNFGMSGELFAVVVGDRLNPVGDRPQDTRARSDDGR